MHLLPAPEGTLCSLNRCRQNYNKPAIDLPRPASLGGYLFSAGRSATGEITRSGDMSANDLRLGDCFELKEPDADEVSDEMRYGLLVDIPGMAQLLHTTSVHHGDSVRHSQRLSLVVSDVDGGDP